MPKITLWDVKKVDQRKESNWYSPLLFVDPIGPYADGTTVSCQLDKLNNIMKDIPTDRVFTKYTARNGDADVLSFEIDGEVEVGGRVMLDYGGFWSMLDSHGEIKIDGRSQKIRSFQGLRNKDGSLEYRTHYGLGNAAAL